MHVNLLLGLTKPKYEPFITHNRGTLMILVQISLDPYSNSFINDSFSSLKE